METSKIMIAPYGTQDWTELGEVKTTDRLSTAKGDWEPPKALTDLSFKCNLADDASGKLAEIFERAYKEFWQTVGDAVDTIMLYRYGCDRQFPEHFNMLFEKHRLCLAFKRNEQGFDEFIGIVANNRWLYTPDGRTIGKKGKNFSLEEL